MFSRPTKCDSIVAILASKRFNTSRMDCREGCVEGAGDVGAGAGAVGIGSYAGTSLDRCS